MSSVIATIERAQLRRVPEFAPGDRLKVHFQVIEGTRRRVQVFEGVVIKRQGHGARETFTVRKQSFGVGVERMFPLHSPKIERIELAARGDVRRAKLYYLRDRVGKRARVRERRYTGPEVAVEPGLLFEQQADGAGEATDAEGMTAQETLAEGVAKQQELEQEQAGAGEQGVAASSDAGGETAQESGGSPDSEDAGEPPAGADPQEEPPGASAAEDPQDATGDGDTPSDAGDAEEGVGVGDAPA